MAILPIRHYPDPVLKEKATPVTEFGGDLLRLADNMAETMYAAPGVGLAAPQVGVLKRLLVIDCSGSEEEGHLYRIANPEIVHSEDEVHEEEGCLSVPGYYAKVSRSARVRVRYQDMAGQTAELDAEGLLAIALQHEIDHLNGVLFVDHLSPMKKGMFRKKYKKIQEQQKEQL